MENKNTPDNKNEKIISSTDISVENKSEEKAKSVKTDDISGSNKEIKETGNEEPPKVKVSIDNEKSGTKPKDDRKEDELTDEKPDIQEEAGQKTVEPEKEEKPSALYWIPAIIILFIISLIPAWKVLPKISTHYLGGGELEGWLWRYWWFKQLIGSLWAQGSKNWGLIIYTYLCAGNYPETGNVFDWQTFSLVLEPIFGDPTAYNFKIILILFCNGIAGYSLTKYLTKKPLLAIIGGAVLILNPYVVYEISNGRPRQAMLFSLPLFVMYLVDNYKTLSLKSGILAGFWLGVSAAVYLFYGMAALFFGLIFVIVQLFIDHTKFTFTHVKYVVVIMLIFLLISGPFSFRYIELVLKKEKLPETSYGRDFPHLDFLLQKNVEVDPRDPLAQSLLRYRSDSAPVLYPFRIKYGLNIPLIVSLFAFIPLLFIRPVPWIWFLSFMFYYVLSLGPYLRFGYGDDNYIRIAQGRPIPLLYAFFFKYIPFFSRLFAPIRMMGMMYICLCALLLTNLDYIINKSRNAIGFLKKINIRLMDGIITLIFLIAIVSQMLYAHQLPISLTEINYPAVYDKMAKNNENFGVIELPFRVGDFGNYYQMYHGKKVLWGWTYGSIPSGFPKSRATFLAAIDPIRENSFVRYLEELNREPEAPPKFKESDLRRIGRMGYKYVILHERGCKELNPDHGELLYDYFLHHLQKALGPPVETGIEKMSWKIRGDDDKDKELRVTVFEIKTKKNK